MLLLVFSLIVILSFFGQAGKLGDALLSGLRCIAGWLAYGVPFLLLKVSYNLLRPNKPDPNRLRLIGAILAIVGLLGILHGVGINQTMRCRPLKKAKAAGISGSC